MKKIINKKITLAISDEHKKKYFSEKQKGGVIYKITNEIDGNFYIGGTRNLTKRYYEHLSNIYHNKNTCTKLIAAANKYGIENFKLEILCECPSDELLKNEQKYFDLLNPEYNVAKIAGSNIGIKRSEEVKLKKSISQKKNWENQEYRDRLLKELSKNWKSGSNHKMAKLSEEQVIQIKKELLKGVLQKKISEQFEVSYYSINDIARGKTWKHIQVEI